MAPGQPLPSHRAGGDRDQCWPLGSLLPGPGGAQGRSQGRLHYFPPLLGPHPAALRTQLLLLAQGSLLGGTTETSGVQGLNPGWSHARPVSCPSCSSPKDHCVLRTLNVGLGARLPGWAGLPLQPAQSKAALISHPGTRELLALSRPHPRVDISRAAPEPVQRAASLPGPEGFPAPGHPSPWPAHLGDTIR